VGTGNYRNNEIFEVLTARALTQVSNYGYYHNFCCNQTQLRITEAVKAFVEGNNVFMSLPTGFGKSLCFVLLPYVFDCLCGETELPRTEVYRLGKYAWS